MKRGSKRLGGLSGVKMASLVLFAVVALSQVAEAGIITSSTDMAGMDAVVGVDDFPLADGEHPTPRVLRSSQQDFGMNIARSGADFNTFPFVFIYQESGQIELVRWLHMQSRLVIPDPIVLSLLKVPIEVVGALRTV